MNSNGYKQKADDDTKNRDRIITQGGIIRFPERLKEAMIKAGGISNSHLAKKSGMSEAVIRKYLKGESLPTLDRLVSLANACDCSLTWLVTGENECATISHKNKSDEQGVILDSVMSEYLAVLSRINVKQREELLNTIYTHGVASLFLINNETNQILFKLPEDEKRRLIALYEAKKGAPEVSEEMTHNSLTSKQMKAG